MFSLISLYFSYRRDVAAAQRHMASLAQVAPQRATAANNASEEITLAHAA
jgi:hypothetical protein